MMATHPWSELQQGFLGTVSHARDSGLSDWRYVWELIVSDSWYQQQLAACARKLVGQQHARSDWTEDVQQEAMTLLARQLRKWPDLRVDVERAQVHFAAWMRGIIYHTCQEAMRHLWRVNGRLANLPQGDLPDPRTLDVPTRVELSLAIDELEDPQRTVILLRLNGFNRKEIAARLGMEYWATCRALEAAVESLRRGLEMDG